MSMVYSMYTEKTIKKETHSRCWVCDAEGDDAEYALLNCPRWTNEMVLLKNYVGQILTTTNIVEVLICIVMYVLKAI